MRASTSTIGQTGAVQAGSAISLFSGAGGLDLGIEAAGFTTSVAVEWDGDAADTMEKNAPVYFPGLHEVMRADLYPLAAGHGAGVTTKDILRAGGFAGRERPDLLVGGPPCVAFSKSGFWLDWKREGVDPAASLLQAYTAVLRDARPRFFILENVYALTFNNKASRPAFERLLAEIEAAGYRHEWKVLHAADYGVPQARPRLFIVGARRGEPLPEFPEPTHHGDWERRKTGGGPLPHATTGEVLAGLDAPEEQGEVVRGRWGHLLDEIPPGENYLYYTARRGHPDPLFEWRSRYWSFLLKLDPNSPSPTIQAQPGPNVGPFHWDNRRLRVPELRRLFTFPDDFEVVVDKAKDSFRIPNGPSVKADIYTPLGKNEYRRFIAKCSHHKCCFKKRSFAQCRLHGRIEPVAFLAAWNDLGATMSEAEHQARGLKPEPIAIRTWATELGPTFFDSVGFKF